MDQSLLASIRQPGGDSTAVSSPSSPVPTSSSVSVSVSVSGAGGEGGRTVHHKAKKAKKAKKKHKKQPKESKTAAETGGTGVGVEAYSLGSITQVQAATGSSSSMMTASTSSAQLEYYQHVQNTDPYLFFVFALNVLTAMDFSVVLPSLFSYVLHLGGGAFYYGLVFGVYSLGQFFASLVMGRLLLSAQIHTLLVISLVLVCAGNVVFLIPQNHNFLYFLLIGRFVAGLGAGLSVAGYAHIIQFSESRGIRSKRIIIYRMLELASRMLAPALGALFSQPWASFLYLGSINKYNVSSLFIILFTLLLFGALQAYKTCQVKPTFSILGYMERSFTEQVKNNSFLPPPTTTEGGGGSNDDDAAALVYSSKRSYTFTLLFVFFVLIFTWWSYVATFLQYYAQSEEWTLAENYLGLMYLGFICSITFICYLYFDLRLYKRKNLLIGMLFMILGSILLLADGSDGRYSTISYVANSLLAVGFSLSTVELPAIYSLLAISHASNARDRSGVQSVTWFFAFVSLARCAGPVFGAYMSNKADIRTLARSCAYLLLAAFGLALLMLGNSALKKRLNILSQHT